MYQNKYCLYICLFLTKSQGNYKSSLPLVPAVNIAGVEMDKSNTDLKRS